MADVTSNAAGAVSRGETIRARRIELGLTLEVCAVRAGVATKTLSRVESGEDVRISTLSRIADVLGLDLLVEKASA